jgi:hypothetical protein
VLLEAFIMSNYQLNANDMTYKMKTAMNELYKQKNGKNLPATGTEDMEMLFMAISRGILEYLDQRENNILNQIELKQENSSLKIKHDVTELKLNIKTGGTL